MKTLITSLMALTLSIGAVNATDSAAASKKANTTVEASTIAFESYQQLLEENRQLKAKVAALGNSTAEMQSTLEYNNMMYNMLTKLRTDENAELTSEAQATISYQKMMSAVLINLKKVK